VQNHQSLSYSQISSLYFSESLILESHAADQLLISIITLLLSADSISDSAVSANIWCHIEQFKTALQQEKMKTCCCCNKCWFQMKLRNNKYADYIKNKQNLFLFSDVNYLNLRSVSTHLSILSEIEKMLIAHVHIHQQIAHVCDHQYQYINYIVCFAQNTSKIWYQLSLLS